MGTLQKECAPGAYKLLSGTIIVPDETDRIIKETYHKEREVDEGIRQP